MGPLLLILLAVLFVASALYALLIALEVVGTSSKAVRERLELSTPVQRSDDEAGPTLRADSSIGGVTRLLARPSSLAKLDRSIQLAGRPKGWTAPKIIAIRTVAVGIALFIFFALVSDGATTVRFMTGVVFVFVAFAAPGVLIQNRATARQEIIQRELPDVLDQVSIAIESGLGFEGAFARIGERRAGPLAEEVVRTVQDMRLGMSRREAYQALADRTDVDDLRRFVKSIVQAEQYGISISSVVRTQAGEIRFKRKARAEGKALQVPVKILFPLLVCILPVLFIVVLTPAIINISKTIG
ncbi:type II secretion system F family protein [Aeromicrobium sp.]|uniref:type II secretion system F family protein n=1 Tax=Aeromicrobium sp. TaxID=1871063 RepID=UPI003C3D4219